MVAACSTRSEQATPGELCFHDSPGGMRLIPKPPSRAIGSAAFSTRESAMKLGIRLLASTLLIVGCSLVGPGNAARSDDGGAEAKVKLERLNWSGFQNRLRENQKIKYTLVDVWSTTCGPCKENFPHVLEMHKKFASKGLQVVSLSLDDPEDSAAVKEAEKFLESKKSTIMNILLDEASSGGFEKLNINTIPAVFLFGPDGKEVRRFTMDDTRNQFTYEEVEKAVSKLLDAKS
jgi:thiol-disulfide isomerase/thioredoxin